MVNLKTVGKLIEARGLWDKPLKLFSALDMIHLSEVFLQAEDEGDLFDYLLKDIQEGGPYFRLWPKIKGYAERTYNHEQFHKLHLAHKLRTANHGGR